MASSLQDQRKLLAAGFALFRLDLEKKEIRVTRKPGCWSKYGEYQTKMECKKVWDVLMANDLCISE